MAAHAIMYVRVDGPVKNDFVGIREGRRVVRSGYLETDVSLSI